MKVVGGVFGRAALATILLVPTAVVSGLAARGDFNTKVVVTASTLPQSIEGWDGQDVPLTDSEKSMLDSPAASQRVYRDLTGNQVQVLVLQVNHTQNAHDPKLCMSGSGYSQIEDKAVSCPWGDGGTSYPVSRAEFKKADSLVTMYYWLQTPEGSVADMSTGLKMEGLKRALTGSTMHGLAIRVIALPNSRDASVPTDPKIAERLWHDIEAQIRPSALIAQM